MFRNQPTPGAGISVTAPVNSASSCALVSVISLTCKPVMPAGPTAKLGPGVLPTNEFAVMGFGGTTTNGGAMIFSYSVIS
jgi:hypothetical protein